MRWIGIGGWLLITAALMACAGRTDGGSVDAPFVFTTWQNSDARANDINVSTREGGVVVGGNFFPICQDTPVGGRFYRSGSDLRLIIESIVATGQGVDLATPYSYRALARGIPPGKYRLHVTYLQGATDQLMLKEVLTREIEVP